MISQSPKPPESRVHLAIRKTKEYSSKALQVLLAKGTTSLVDQGVVSATNFLTGVIIGRACAKEELGLYMLGMSIVLFLTNLQTSLISTPYMIYSPRLDHKEQTEYTGSVLFHQMAAAFLAIVALSIGAFSASLGSGGSDIQSVLYALALTISFILIREFTRQACFALLQVRAALYVDISVALIQISGLLVLAVFGHLSAATAFSVVGFACAAVVASWFFSIRQSIVIRFPRIIPDLKLNWSLGGWIFASGLLWSLSITIYPWVLTAFHGTAITGVWAACAGVAALGNPVLLGFQNFLGPKISHSFPSQDLDRFRRSVLQHAKTFSLIVLPVAVPLILAGDLLVVSFYGNKFSGYGNVVSVLALNFIVSAFGFPFSRALFTIEKACLDFAVNFLILFFLVFVGIWLVKTLGPLGVAIGFLGGNIVATTGRFIIFNIVIDRRILQQQHDAI